MALLQPKVPFWVFPCVRWNPYFCSVWWLSMGTKKSDIFQKQIVATKMLTFFTFRTQIVFAYFSKKWQFYKQIKISSQPPKKHYFSRFFFEIFPFHVFHVLSFSFSNMKKTKTKSAHFFSKTLFLTPWQTAKKLFSHPYTLFVSFKIPPKHYQTGEKQAKKILDQVLTQPWTKFWLKNPKSWTKFWLYSIYAVESKLGPKIAFFESKLGPSFLLFFFLCFSKIFFFLEGEWDFKEKRANKRQKNTISWVKTWSNYVAQHTWTKFWLNLGPSFDSTFLLIFGYFYLF